VTDVTDSFSNTSLLQLATSAKLYPFYLPLYLSFFYIDQCSRTIHTSYRIPEAQIHRKGQVRDKFSKIFKHLPKDSTKAYHARRISGDFCIRGVGTKSHPNRPCTEPNLMVVSFQGMRIFSVHEAFFRILSTIRKPDYRFGIPTTK
jgi:hypothetical protein